MCSSDLAQLSGIVSDDDGGHDRTVVGFEVPHFGERHVMPCLGAIANGRDHPAPVLQGPAPGDAEGDPQHGDDERLVRRRQPHRDYADRGTSTRW